MLRLSSIPRHSSALFHHGQCRSSSNVFTSRSVPMGSMARGLDLAIKDNISTVDFPTTCASAMLKRHVSPFDASVADIGKTGAQRNVMGKTNMDEFGMGSHSKHSAFGTVKADPPFHDISVGGSSGGSAAAVVGNECVLALGTDTGGSVRLPAAYTGIPGFKPSYGLVPRWGVVPYANSLDTVGILARKVTMLQREFDRINQHDPRDPTSLSIKSRMRLDEKRRRSHILGDTALPNGDRSTQSAVCNNRDVASSVGKKRSQNVSKRLKAFRMLESGGPTKNTSEDPVHQAYQVFTTHYTQRAMDPSIDMKTLEIVWQKLFFRRYTEPAICMDRMAKILPELTIGVPLEYNIEELESPIRDVWIRTLKFLQNEGCTVKSISLPNTKHALSAYYVIAASEAASNLSKYDAIRYGSRGDDMDDNKGVLYSKARGDGFGQEVKRRILLGSYTLSSQAIDNHFIKAQKVRRLVQRDFDRVFSMPNMLRPTEQFNLSDLDEHIDLDSKLGLPQVDVIICPTAPSLAPTMVDLSHEAPVDTYMSDVFTVPASLAGVPAISIPGPIHSDYHRKGVRTQAGIQLISQHGDDATLLELGNFLLNSYHKIGFSDEIKNAPNMESKQSRGDARPDRVVSPGQTPVQPQIVAGTPLSNSRRPSASTGRRQALTPTGRRRLRP